jgi:hypothetical protein
VTGRKSLGRKTDNRNSPILKGCQLMRKPTLALVGLLVLIYIEPLKHGRTFFPKRPVTLRFRVK